MIWYYLTINGTEILPASLGQIHDRITGLVTLPIIEQAPNMFLYRLHHSHHHHFSIWKVAIETWPWWWNYWCPLCWLLYVYYIKHIQQQLHWQLEWIQINFILVLLTQHHVAGNIIVVTTQITLQITISDPSFLMSLVHVRPMNIASSQQHHSALLLDIVLRFVEYSLKTEIDILF